MSSEGDCFRDFFWTLMVSLAAGEFVKIENDMSDEKTESDAGIPEVTLDIVMPFPGCFMQRVECLKCRESVQAPFPPPANMGLPVCKKCGGDGWALVSAATEMAREALAAVQHEIWAHWMRYLFSKAASPGNTTRMWKAGAVLLKEDVERWKRQMETPYSELSEQERESDREQADKVLAVLMEGL